MRTSIHFLSRDPLFEHEKPYSMRYAPAGNIAQSNLKFSEIDVSVTDMRVDSSVLNFEKTGFDLIHLDSKMAYEDFDDEATITAIYVKEVTELLKARFNAPHVQVLDFNIRRRHPDYPKSTGQDYKVDQPTSLVHIDFTHEEAVRIIEKRYGDQAPAILASHWEIVNVWRPLKGPLKDWPLAICDRHSMNPDEDTMPADIVMPTFVTENVQIHHSPSQKWFWLSEQQPSEILLFKSADSDEN